MRATASGSVAVLDPWLEGSDMDEEEFRKLLIKQCEKDLDDRVKRWRQLDPITYDGRLAPNLVGDYSREATRLFIDGYYLGALLLCAGIAEMVLADQLKKKGADLPKYLSQKIDECQQEGILNDVETGQLHALTKLRNDIIHVNPEQLIERGKGSFEESVVGPSPTNYLRPFFGGPIDEDTLAYLKTIMNLIVKLYPTEG